MYVRYVGLKWGFIESGFVVVDELFWSFWIDNDVIEDEVINCLIDWLIESLKEYVFFIEKVD